MSTFVEQVRAAAGTQYSLATVESILNAADTVRRCPATTALERARRGAALLDREQPGWHQHIDITDLHMTSCLRCILGHLYGDFGVGVYELLRVIEPDASDYDDLSLRVEFATSHGFDMDSEADAEALTAAWLDEINTRRWSTRPGNLAFAGGGR